MIQNEEISTACHTKAAHSTHLLLLTLFCLSSCSQTPEMIERLPPLCTLTPSNYNDVPVILAGIMTEDTTPVGKFHRTRYDSQLLTRRYRVKMKVENVLQGDVTPGEIVNVFFFIDNRNLGSSGIPMNFPPGTREILFLQRDYGELRTISDQFSNLCAIRVFSGAHPKFKRNLSNPVTEDIADLLLTRGEGVSDKQMMEAIDSVQRYSFIGQKPITQKLQQVAREETPPVREAACSFLKDQGHPCKEDAGKEVTVRQ